MEGESVVLYNAGKLSSIQKQLRYGTKQVEINKGIQRINHLLEETGEIGQMKNKLHDITVSIDALSSSIAFIHTESDLKQNRRPYPLSPFIVQNVARANEKLKLLQQIHLGAASVSEQMGNLQVLPLSRLEVSNNLRRVNAQMKKQDAGEYSTLQRKF